MSQVVFSIYQNPKIDSNVTEEKDLTVTVIESRRRESTSYFFTSLMLYMGHHQKLWYKLNVDLPISKYLN